MKQESIFHIIRRQFVLFVLVAGFGLGLTALVIVFAPRKYQSNAKFLLRMGRENLSVDPTASTTGEVATLHRTRESEVRSAVDGMRSRRILENVIQDVGIQPILNGSLVKQGTSEKNALSEVKAFVRSKIESLDPIDDSERAILTLSSGLSIDAPQDSSVIDVWYRTKSPEMAQRVVDSWVKAYQVEHASINASKGSFAFFQAQEERLLQNLENVRDKLLACKSASGLLTIEGGQQILERQMEQARLSKSNVESKLAGARARLASLTSQQENTPQRVTTGEATAHTSDARQKMRETLYALEIEERGLSGKYDADHPALLSVKKQLDDARRIYETYQDSTKETVEGMNPLFVSITEQVSLEESNVKALQSELASIEKTVVSLVEQFKQLNRSEADLARLQRQVDVMETQYQAHFIKREQARLGEELLETNISNLSLIQDPTLERRPVSPNKMLCALLGCVGSLFAATGLAVLREARYQMRLVSSVETMIESPALPATIGSHPPMTSSDRRHAEHYSGELVSSLR